MKRKRRRIKFLFLVAVFVGILSACTLPGGNDLALNLDEVALVQTGVAETQAGQVPIGTPDLVIQGVTPTSTELPLADEVQQPATETPLPEVAQPVPTNTQPPSPTPIPEVWDGTWKTNCFYAPGCSDVILEQTGTSVVGTYRDGDGEIEGMAVGNHLTGVWKVGGEIGTLDFWLNNAGTRWRGSYNGSYYWCGARENTSFPDPCGVSTYYGTWDLPCIGDDCLMVVTQDGRNVNGTYPNGGTISGIVTDTHFKGTWERDGNSGSLDFWMMPGGKSWHGNADVTQGWCGFRDIENNLTECGINSWYGTWVSQCGGAGCGNIIMNQDGKKITGTYANGSGTISGTISGDELTGTWTRGATSGNIHFYMNDNGYQFQGNYDSSYPWCGYLTGQSPPAVCYQQ